MAALFSVILFGVALPKADAIPPHPWLCRQMPVFSSSKPMTYRAVNRSSHRWVLTFMIREHSTLHVGFRLVSTRYFNRTVEGTLPPGQWYAIALYRMGDLWICPQWAREADEPKPGVVSNVCYNEEHRGCSVNLVVKPAASSTQTSAR